MFYGIFLFPLGNVSMAALQCDRQYAFLIPCLGSVFTEEDKCSPNKNQCVVPDDGNGRTH